MEDKTKVYKPDDQPSDLSDFENENSWPSERLKMYLEIGEKALDSVDHGVEVFVGLVGTFGYLIGMVTAQSIRQKVHKTPKN